MNVKTRWSEAAGANRDLWGEAAPSPGVRRMPGAMGVAADLDPSSTSTHEDTFEIFARAVASLQGVSDELRKERDALAAHGWWGSVRAIVHVAEGFEERIAMFTAPRPLPPEPVALAVLTADGARLAAAPEYCQGATPVHGGVVFELKRRKRESESEADYLLHRW